MRDEDIEAAALIDLTDDLQDAAADTNPSVVGGGCFSVAMIALIGLCLLQILTN